MITSIPQFFQKLEFAPLKNGKTFVIIRIPQSNETPHAIYNNTQVYIRTGLRNKPENLASIEQIEWLKNRRQKSEDLKKPLLKRADERYQLICKNNKATDIIGEFSLSFVPSYPQKSPIDLENIKRTVDEIKVQDHEFPNIKFPEVFMPAELIQDGIMHFHLSEDGKLTHTEINRFGLFYFKTNNVVRLRREEEDKGPYQVIYTNELIQYLDLSFEAICKFYDAIGFWELIDIDIKLENIFGIRLIPPINLSRTSISQLKQNATERKLEWNYNRTLAQMKESKEIQNILFELVKEISWSFGYQANEEILIDKLKKRGIWAD